MRGYSFCGTRNFYIKKVKYDKKHYICGMKLVEKLVVLKLAGASKKIWQWKKFLLRRSSFVCKVQVKLREWISIGKIGLSGLAVELGKTGLTSDLSHRAS